MSGIPPRDGTPALSTATDDLPAFTIGRRTHTGRHLAPDERAQHVAALYALEHADVPDAVALATIHAFVHALFPDEPLTPPIPPPPRWAFWRRPPLPPLYPIDLFRALPLAHQVRLALRWGIVEGVRQLEAEREHAILEEARRAPVGPTRTPHS